ncbi:MAG: hypothetical protein HYS81_00745 [Candidatus Aenigmatarchaeota archaeon]|nr:MAG: hypothetical protein HYS81_00745 [Candidatus Aenigmarchaeota archaeon]
MAYNWTTIALAVILFLIVAVVVIAGTAQAGQAVGQSGGGGACNIYCVMRDAIQPLPAPGFCGC